MRALGLLVVMLLLQGSACVDGNLVGAQARCRNDAECGPSRFCQPSGHCGCRDNRACGDGEFCNASFACQPIAGCQDNADCELQTGGDPLICDVKSSRCESSALCFDDVHCSMGKICDPIVGACSAGCRDEADCPLGQGCIRDNPAAPFGACLAGSCNADGQCAVGSSCDITTSKCVADQRGPFCGACQRFDPLDPQCGDPANYCLIDTGDPTRRGHYCGVDCSQGQGCPNGYTCANVIIVGLPGTEACGAEACRAGVCTETNAPCSQNSDCPIGLPGGNCARAHTGICAGTLDTACTTDADCGGSENACKFAECRLRENSAYGFCSCVLDIDCPQDNCRGSDLTDPQNPIAGHCHLSGHACYSDEDCAVIACVNGGCLIGRNCKPGNDRRCADLQTNNGETE